MQYIVNDRKIIIHRGEGRLEKERKHHGKFFLASQRERKKEKEKVSSFFLHHLIKMMNFFSKSIWIYIKIKKSIFPFKNSWAGRIVSFTWSLPFVFHHILRFFSKKEEEEEETEFPYEEKSSTINILWSFLFEMAPSHMAHHKKARSPLWSIQRLYSNNAYNK